MNKNVNYLQNTVWLLIGKVYRMSLALVATVVLARYLGPENFGVYNYALSLVSIFSVLVTLGIDNLVVREIINKPKEVGETLASGLIVRIIGATFLIIIAALFISFLRPNQKEIIILVQIFSIGIGLKSFEIFRYWFEAHVKSKYCSLVEFVAIALSFISKISLVIFEAPVTYFAFALVIENATIGAGLIFIYSGLREREEKLTPKLSKMRYLIKESWPLILAGALYALYSKVDQIMLGELMSDKSVGLYAAAVKLSEGWFFVPAAIASSLYPLMIKSKKESYEKYIATTQHLMNVMIIVSIVASFSIVFLSSYFIKYIYGSAYDQTSDILIVHIWGGVFLSMSWISFRYFLTEGLQKYSFYRGITGLIVNISLNFLLIPMYGGLGAAISTLISQAIALYLINFASRKTREVFYLQTRALFFVNMHETVKYIRSKL